MASPVYSVRAKNLILDGAAPDGMEVDGVLDLSGEANLKHLPAGLTVRRLVLSNCTGLEDLPPDLRVTNLDVVNCTRLSAIPDGVRPIMFRANGSGVRSLPSRWTCYELHAAETPLASLPADLQVQCKLVLSGCEKLESLPENLKVGSLDISGCTSLESLPENLDVWFLDIQGCRGLTAWPRAANLGTGHLNMSNCVGLTELPGYVRHLATLNISGCAALAKLPEGLTVGLWIDVAESGVRRLPNSLAGVGIRWKNVLVDERIAFRPETIQISEIVEEANAERRRVLIERVGYEWFLENVKAEVRDSDQDPGGPRSLLRMPLSGDEDLVCLSVICPSTARRYLIRVPPTMSKCHQAAAWIAGFDNPAEYRPLVET